MFIHDAAPLLSHNFSRTDLFLVVYCMVDSYMKRRYGRSSAPRRSRQPKSNEIADSEVMTIILVGELCHAKRERAWLRQVRSSYSHLFPHLPEDSRFSRRAQKVRETLRFFRYSLLHMAGADLETVRIIDSFPMPLCACYRISQSSRPISGSDFAWNASKKEFYFGLHPQLIITEKGYIEDIFLAPAQVADVQGLASYLDECAELKRDVSGQEWILDKGYVSKELKDVALKVFNVKLLARNRDKKGVKPDFWERLGDKLRRPIEGVVSFLTECFNIEHVLVRSDMGIYRRAQAKATAFTLGRYLNEALGKPALSIAAYAV